MLRIGINGFGRIGRLTMRAAMKQDQVKVVAVNDLASNVTLAHLLKYDSTFGVLDADIQGDDEGFVINGERIRVTSEREPAKIPWKEAGVDLVVESTGIFRTKATASAHLSAGAKRVIITAPGEADIMIVLGVNDHLYDPAKHIIISNASCTTNALAPIAKVLHENFGIVKGLMNTTHAYTNDQQLLDFPHSDLRRSRAAALSMIPTSTGAAKSVGEVLPELKGKIDGLSIRVPVPTVSLVDFVVVLEKDVTVDLVNEALKKEASGSKYFAFSDLPLVSSDFKGNPYSAVVDGLSTMVIGGNMARVLGWYDNEWAYSCRVVDLAALIASK